MDKANTQQGISEPTSLKRRLPQPKEACHKGLELGPSPAHLRGGADSHQSGLSRWFARLKGEDKHVGDHGDGSKCPVKYKGKTIGSPQLVSALNVLPPGSRYVKQPYGAASDDYNAAPPIDRSAGVGCLSARLSVDRITADFTSLSSARSDRDLSRDSSSYGLINCALESSPETGEHAQHDSHSTTFSRDYLTTHVAGTPMHSPLESANFTSGPHSHDLYPAIRYPQKKMGRDNLPPLPNGRASGESLPKNDPREADDESDDLTDTEDLLNMLRPERLSLYHIQLPRHKRQRIDFEKEQQGQSITFDGQHSPSLLRGRRESHRDINYAQIGLPEEDTATPETTFYSYLIDIVQDYNEQVQRVKQRAHETGQLKQGHWLRERWRYRNTMEKRLAIAEYTSGYRILTNEGDIMEAIKQPIGYAIYSSLYKIRDHDKWQRVFEPASRKGQTSFVDTLRRLLRTLMLWIRWVVLKAGRTMRFLLAIPEDVEVKTHSSRHIGSDPFRTGEPHINAAGPATPLRTLQRPLPSPPSAPSRQLFPTTHNTRRPTTNVAANLNALNEPAPSKLSRTLSGNTLAPSLIVTPLRTQRSRGYNQGAYVTKLDSSANSLQRGARMVSDGRKAADEWIAEDKISENTVWPQPDF